MKHMDTDCMGVDTARDNELPEMVASDDGVVAEATTIDFSEPVFGDRSHVDDFSALNATDEDRAMYRVRIAELSEMSDTEIVQAISRGLAFLLEFEDAEGNLFLHSLSNKLRAANPDVRAIVRMWRHGGCDAFPDVRALLQSYDLPMCRQRLSSAEFFQDARRRRYIR